MPASSPTSAYSSPRRERVAGSSYNRQPASSPTPSAHSVRSLQEARLREGEEIRSHSPRTAVAGRLEELAIHGGQHGASEDPSGSAGKGPTVASSAPTTSWLRAQHSLENTSAEANNAIIGVPEFAAGNQHQDEDGARMSPTPFASQNTSPNSRKKRNSPAKSKAHEQRRSPPPVKSVVENSLTWHDSEITGHELSDPNDDGYGINGIGFKPTAAMAWARSQKRRRQVADWRSRETREAREKRRERRERIEPDKMRTVQQGAIQKKVKFNV